MTEIYPLLTDDEDGNPIGRERLGTPTLRLDRDGECAQQNKGTFVAPSVNKSSTNSPSRFDSAGTTGINATTSGPPHNKASTHKTKVVKKAIGKQPTRTRKAVAAFRKKGRQVPEYETWRGRIGVHLPVDGFDLKIVEGIVNSTLPGWELANHYDLIRLWQKPVDFLNQLSSQPLDKVDMTSAEMEEQLMNAATREVFIFSFGAVVFYNFINRKYETDWIEQHLSSPSVYGDKYPASAVEAAEDDLEFEYQTGSSQGPIPDDNNIKGAESSEEVLIPATDGTVLKFSIKHDVCQFVTTTSGEKLAVAFAVAKSALLSYYEWTLQQTIERNSDIPEELAQKGTIPMKKKDICREIGRIFLVMHQVNLDSNLQDTPEEFWDDDLYEKQYTETLKYFDTSKRIALINVRLGMLQDLHTVLNEELRNQHGVFLEWIVIWLIVAYLVLEFYDVAVQELNMLRESM